MTIEKTIENISALLDAIDPESLSSAQREEILLITDRITSDIERVENIETLTIRLKSAHTTTQKNKLKSILKEKVTQGLEHDKKQEVRMVQKNSTPSPLTPFEKN